MWIARLHNLLLRHVWEVDPAGLPRWRGRLVHAARVGFLVLRDLADGQLTLMR